MISHWGDPVSQLRIRSFQTHSITSTNSFPPPKPVIASKYSLWIPEMPSKPSHFSQDSAWWCSSTRSVWAVSGDSGLRRSLQCQKAILGCVICCSGSPQGYDISDCLFSEGERQRGPRMYLMTISEPHMGSFLWRASKSIFTMFWRTWVARAVVNPRPMREPSECQWNQQAKKSKKKLSPVSNACIFCHWFVVDARSHNALIVLWLHTTATQRWIDKESSTRFLCCVRFWVYKPCTFLLASVSEFWVGGSLDQTSNKSKDTLTNRHFNHLKSTVEDESSCDCIRRLLISPIQNDVFF